jgi:hypothetical protein
MSNGSDEVPWWVLGAAGWWEQGVGRRSQGSRLTVYVLRLRFRVQGSRSRVQSINVEADPEKAS